MKRLIFTLLLIVNVTMLKAQFTENFDGPGPYGLTSTGTPGWSIDANYSTSTYARLVLHITINGMGLGF